MTQPKPLKQRPDDENEIMDLIEFRDEGVCRATPVARFAPDVAAAVVSTLAGIVRAAHRTPHTLTHDEDGIVRAQVFEEGDVYMLEAPFDGFAADRYLMDFYDVTERNVCSRMHLHTGLRFVRMMTGPGTEIRVSSLSPFQFTWTQGITPFAPECFTDPLPDVPEGHTRTRYNFVVPENSWVDVQIPRATSHQFNAMGPNAVIDSVHPEESVETFREHMSSYRMMAQTLFLAEERPPATSCVVPTAATSKGQLATDA
jgi:hypothetical protein